MLGLPDFVFYLIAGSISAFVLSAERTLAHRYIPHFPSISLLLGSLFIKGRKGGSERTVKLVGRVLHLLMGALWGLLFGTLVDAKFFFAEFNVPQGMIFSLLPWLMFMLFFLPLTGSGFFGLKVNKFQWFLGLVMHLVYGATLGFLLSVFINRPF